MYPQNFASNHIGYRGLASREKADGISFGLSAGIGARPGQVSYGDLVNALSPLTRSAGNTILWLQWVVNDHRVLRRSGL